MTNPTGHEEIATAASIDRAAHTATAVAGGGQFLRWLIYTHLLAVMVCGAMSYLDRTGSWPEAPQFVTLLLWPIGAWAILSIVVYPLLTLWAIATGRPRIGNPWIAILLEGLLVLTQMIAIFPAIC